MTALWHLARSGRLAAAASALLLAIAGCGGEQSGDAQGSAAAPSIPQMDKGAREVPLPREDAVAQVAAGELPEGYPADLPTPPDSEPKNALFIPGHGGLATFVSDSPGATIGDYFKQELPRQGWSIDDTSEDAKRITIMASKGERTARVLIIGRADETEIAITLQGI